MSHPDQILNFLHICERLKTTKRTGWVRDQIQGPESISDHMHRMSLIALLIPQDSPLNKQRIVQMAIVHDLAEAIVGDIVPGDMSKTEKSALEAKAMIDMMETLGNTSEAQFIHELWLEYEHANTPEALFCKDMDKFEMIMQAFEYEQREGKRLESYFESTEGKFKHPMIQKWAEALLQKRNLFFTTS